MVRLSYQALHHKSTTVHGKEKMIENMKFENMHARLLTSYHFHHFRTIDPMVRLSYQALHHKSTTVHGKEKMIENMKFENMHARLLTSYHCHHFR